VVAATSAAATVTSAAAAEEGLDERGHGGVERAAFALEQAIVSDKQGSSKPEEDIVPLYMEAAALFLGAISEERDPGKKKDLESTAGGILSRVEEIKGIKTEKTERATPKTVTQGQQGKQASGASIRPLTEDEAAVLKHSSIINGHVCLPWLAADLYKESFLSPAGEALFTDQVTLGLSPSQQRRFAGWRRPEEFCINPTMIMAISPQAVTQNCVTNCSFVCSLAVAANYERRFHRPLVTSIIYPQRRDGTPVMNPYGKYVSVSTSTAFQGRW